MSCKTNNICLILSLATWVFPFIDVISAEPCVCLQNTTTGLYNPIRIEFIGESFYIAEQRGIVRYFESHDKKDTVLLDISDRVLKTANPFNEQGLLGFTLHPGYKGNGKLYVFYMAEIGSDKFSQLSEFTAHDNVAKSSTERYLMRIEKASNAGNGGQLLFGHDGYLYISVGDGVGDVGQKQDNAQKPYGIPPNNPFVDKSPWRPEVFAYGCRDMWRCSQDMLPDPLGEHRIFCGDPGARAYEEIDIIRGGRNYGWDVMEGNKCYDKEKCASGSLENEELPIYVYKHTALHHAVVGGYVYRGNSIPVLSRRYIFGDALNGNMSVLTESNGAWTSSPLSLCPPATCPCDARETLRSYIMSFGQDTKGEVYVLTTSTYVTSVNDGVALKLVSSLGHKTTCGASHSTMSLGYRLAAYLAVIIMLIIR